MNWMGLSEHQHLYEFQHKVNQNSSEISMSGTSSNPLATDWFMIITTKIYFCFRVYWKERYISHSAISSQVKNQKSSNIFFLSGNETLLKTLFCILFFHKALLTYFGQTFGDIFSMTHTWLKYWKCTLCSTENTSSTHNDHLLCTRRNTRQLLHKPALIGTGKTQTTCLTCQLEFSYAQEHNEWNSLYF